MSNHVDDGQDEFREIVEETAAVRVCQACITTFNFFDP